MIRFFNFWHCLVWFFLFRGHSFPELLVDAEYIAGRRRLSSSVVDLLAESRIYASRRRLRGEPARFQEWYYKRSWVVSAHRRYAGFQLRLERMHGNYPGAIVLQVSTSRGSASLLGRESSGKKIPFNNFSLLPDDNLFIYIYIYLYYLFRAKLISITVYNDSL